jgi:hypothetical protein
MPARGRAWGLMFATFAFGVMAFGLLGLLALAFAALLGAAGLSRPRERVVAILVGAAGLGLVLSTAADVLDAAVGAYSLIVAAAFAGGALLAPAGVWRQATRATLWGVAATAGLGLALRGSRFWAELQWSVMHQTSSAMRTVVEWRPDSYRIYEPMVHFLSTAFPGLLALQTLAALTLAWQWHQRIATVPLGAPAVPFRQFRFGDHWVWALVGALLVWAVPKLAALKGVALNLGLVLSVLYCLRGAAIVVALAGGAGIPFWILTVGTLIAIVLVVPLLVLIPSLWTLGVFDTWLAFRQRRAGQPSVR